MSMVDRTAVVGKLDEVEVRFEGKNLTTVGGMRLFHRFTKKLGVEETFGRRLRVPPRAGKQGGSRVGRGVYHRICVRWSSR